MPYNPQAAFDPSLITGAGDRAAALGGVIGSAISDYKQQKKEAKAAKAIFDALQPEPNAATGAQKPHPLGMSKEQFESLSWRDQSTMVQGLIKAEALKSAFAEHQQRMQAGNQNQVLNSLKIQGAQGEMAAEERFGSMAQGQPVLRALQEGRGPIKPGLTSIDDLMAAARSNPTAPSARPLIQSMDANGGQPIMPIPANVGGRNLIVNPRSGAFQDVTPQPAPKIPEGLVPLGATEDEDGGLKIRYGFPKAEGKALTQTEVGGIAALNQAEMDLNTLEKIYNDLGPGYGGPVSGRAKSAVMGGQNPNIAALENAITAATPNLARGVFREVGVLTDQDIERYKKLLPSPYDTQEVRTRKVKQLRDRIAQGKQEMVKSLRAAGRDVEGFGAAPEAAAQRFDSEAAARTAGAKAGDVIELYDPDSATYRKARLK